MGTSTSSSGPGSGNPLDPPWLDDVASGVGSGSGVPIGDPGVPPRDGPTGNAAPARYREARTQLRKFINTGDRASLGRALGHYSRSGSGGAGAAASRMRASTKAGAELFSLLSAAATRSSAEARAWVDDLRNSGATADDVVNAIVKELAPPGGSADEESLRDAMAAALSDLLVQEPNLDLLSLGQDDIWSLMSLFLAIEVTNRVCFDIGQSLESSQVEPAIAVQREQEMRGFIRSEVRTAVRALRTTTANPTRAELDDLMQVAVKTTFEVFEGLL
ncbi:MULTISPECIES: Qat anti-phage system associated protein QatB [unclassified Roseateles]|uniref:Qat anti-phage system associated protein QatB n=1 Tax=unclassified Roseateles TaxID=2626991 RepID=UPI0006FAE0E8|nr:MULTISPECIES: Qat anti-phage system associated protein QatB [unclassified Roseateles]KQW43309.1 hypothetical protein ASC81_16065 [Pelomonas sp. Root405]KRA71047.1 hypothetical protein ASD88_14590 [Pelomonas sp. Root662]